MSLAIPTLRGGPNGVDRFSSELHRRLEAAAAVAPSEQLTALGGLLAAQADVEARKDEVET
jgi:hypothetical protein